MNIKNINNDYKQLSFGRLPLWDPIHGLIKDTTERYEKNGSSIEKDSFKRTVEGIRQEPNYTLRTEGGFFKTLFVNSTLGRKPFKIHFIRDFLGSLEKAKNYMEADRKNVQSIQNIANLICSRLNKIMAHSFRESTFEFRSKLLPSISADVVKQCFLSNISEEMALLHFQGKKQDCEEAIKRYSSICNDYSARFKVSLEDYEQFIIYDKARPDHPIILKKVKKSNSILKDLRKIEKILIKAQKRVTKLILKRLKESR